MFGYTESVALVGAADTIARAVEMELGPLGTRDRPRLLEALNEAFIDVSPWPALGQPRIYPSRIHRRVELKVSP